MPPFAGQPAHGVGYDRDRRIVLSRGADLRRRAAAARPFGRRAERGRHHHAAHPLDQPQPADHFLGNGYGDRGAARHRHGASRRHRGYPPQSRARTAGRGSPQGEAFRERHGGQSDHHLSRRDARRRARLDAPAQHFRHSRRRARRQRASVAALRHSHQPGRAFRRQSAAARLAN